MTRLRRFFTGGTAANEQLTALAACALILFLAVEGVTLLRIGSLLTVHAFVGMLLIPLVALKLASTAWRALRYYLRVQEYVLRGPPQLLLRVVVAPVVVLSTAVLFGTGVALLVLDQTHGTLVGVHKVSFIVWFAATSVHVLAHLANLPRYIWRRVPGLAARLAIVAVALGAGAAVAVATLPAADRLQDRTSQRFGFDER